MWVILRRLSPNALKLPAADADDRHPNFIVKLRITLHLQRTALKRPIDDANCRARIAQRGPDERSVSGSLFA